jgi:hypothetical protein
MMSPDLPPEAEALLAEMPQWGSEFDRTFANHAPMVLTALARIGGSPGQMQRFFDHYRGSKTLRPFGPVGNMLDDDTWRTAIGQREREPDLRVFFTGEVARLGIDGALRLFLPVLVGGVAASAFHALMRTAYGVLRQNESDIAVALAYWAATYLALPPSRGRGPITRDPAEVLSRVAGIEALHRLTLHELLWQNIRDATATAAFEPVVDWLEIGPDAMKRMAATAIQVFSATQHFAALHIVTGLHWIRLIAPHCDQTTLNTMLRVFWQAIAALMPEMGFPALPAQPTFDAWRRIPAPGWAEIRSAAAASFDEHDISLAFSACEEMSVYCDPLYRVATARRLGLIGEYRT